MKRYHFIAAYMLASQKRGTLYIGSTANLLLRMEQHRSGEGSRFTGRYSVSRLVWFQRFDRMTDAVQCERTMKHWRRDWKLDLIEEQNPLWRDLCLDIILE